MLEPGRVWTVCGQWEAFCHRSWPEAQPTWGGGTVGAVGPLQKAEAHTCSGCADHGPWSLLRPR